MVETAFYWSLLLSSAFDVKRSDFRELVIHHVVTIGLLWLSWTINMVRVGTLVLLSHDISDILLAAGKLFRHGRTWVKTTNVLFVLFLISWILLRLGYFPLVVLRTALLDAPTFIQPSYRWQNIFQRPFVPRIILAMLLCLQVLHLFWTFLIARTVVKTVTAGQAEDVRSDSEDDDRTESKKD
uniref:TLC domain-containing protein n=1 Tax=Plectus sambesii TaxID=2011161 RepID=A0A914W3K8_9BILA